MGKYLRFSSAVATSAAARFGLIAVQIIDAGLTMWSRRNEDVLASIRFNGRDHLVLVGEFARNQHASGGPYIRRNQQAAGARALHGAIATPAAA
jgi:hypothetical protein